jgi:phage FluMu protein Com
MQYVKKVDHVDHKVHNRDELVKHRCTNCGKLLLKVSENWRVKGGQLVIIDHAEVYSLIKQAEVKCPRCKEINRFEI